nr:MAG TPA: terminase small subunit [Caudoviricetes sp.]
MHGLTQAEICEQIGVPTRTFRRWCTQDPRIANAVSVGAEAALASVENALFKKAQSGDLGAMCFYLKNRDPEHWSEHPELRGYDGKVVFVDDIPKTETPKPSQAAAETEQPDHP